MAADPSNTAYSTIPKTELNAGYNIMCPDPSFNQRVNSFATPSGSQQPNFIANASYLQHHGYQDYNTSKTITGPNNLQSQICDSTSYQMNNWNMSKNTLLQQTNDNYIYPENYPQTMTIEQRNNLLLQQSSVCQVNNLPNLQSTTMAANYNLNNIPCQEQKQPAIVPTEDIDDMTDSFSNIL